MPLPRTLRPATQTPTAMRSVPSLHPPLPTHGSQPRALRPRWLSVRCVPPRSTSSPTPPSSDRHHDDDDDDAALHFVLSRRRANALLRADATRAHQLSETPACCRPA
eukprot:1917164-Rhodomonas_salina.1